MFGRLQGSRVSLTPLGELIVERWNELPAHYSNVLLDSFAVMPEHLHALLVLTDPKVGEASLAPTTGPRHVAHSLGAVIGNFKSGVTRAAHRELGLPGRIWQRGYYDHIVRNERDADQIRQYIASNPMALSLKRTGLT
jgi:REP element-mobilizing transposase RayT